MNTAQDSEAGISKTVSEEEIARFAQTSSQWWDERGPYRILNALNPVRLRYIRDALTRHFLTDAHAQAQAEPLRLLDIGCGGGLLCAPLARQGYDVTGIDACGPNIAAARTYAEAHNLHIVYHDTDAASFSVHHAEAPFDAILLMELLEHVPHPAMLINQAVSLLKPGGLIFFSTLNRSWLSRVLAIGVAEYVMRWVPQGTHQGGHFLRPSEVLGFLAAQGIRPCDVTGALYNPLTHQWSLTPTCLQVNYMGYGMKQSA